MGTGAPIFGRPSFAASEDASTDPSAPVSITKGNGPFPSMQTLTLSATCPAFTLTVMVASWASVSV